MAGKIAKYNLRGHEIEDFERDDYLNVITIMPEVAVKWKTGCYSYELDFIKDLDNTYFIVKPEFPYLLEARIDKECGTPEYISQQLRVKNWIHTHKRGFN